MTYAYIRTSSIFLFLVCLCVYVGYSVFVFISGPSITLSTTPYQLSSNRGYTLTGSASHFLSLTINGRPVVTRPDGTFADRTLLAPGTNTFVVDAVDSFGVRTREVATIVYAPEGGDVPHTARITPIEEALRF